MKRLNDKAAIDLRPPTHSTGGSPRHSSGLSSHVSSTTPTPSRLKLDLPKFSGELLDWREFWSIFFACLEREVGLTDVQKFTCLEDAMTDQTAKDLVCLNGYGGSYENVVQALQDRYNRHKLVYKHHVKQVLSLSLQSPTTITATPTSRALLSNTATVFRQVEATPLNNSSHHSLRDSFPAMLLPCGGPNSLLRVLALLLSRPSWTPLTEESRTRRRSPTLLSIRLPLQIVIVRHHPTTALASQIPERRIIQEPST